MHFWLAVCTCFGVVLLTGEAWASPGAGSSLPWEGPLTQIANSLTGPVAKAGGVIAIAVSGLTLAMGESGGFFRRMLQVVFGLGVAFSAATWGVSFLGFGSGVTL
ncbi:MAG: TrbC/VirB2 family protein [Myxococcota bacterium]